MTALPPPHPRMGWVAFDLIVLVMCAAFLRFIDLSMLGKMLFVVTGAFAFGMLVREITRPFEW